MVCMVDVMLRASTVSLVQCALNEENEGKIRANHGHGGNETINAVDKMHIFYKLVKSIVQKRLRKFECERLRRLILTSEDFLAEGHGSIEICEPPTEAQSRIVKSLVRVIFHQLAMDDSSEAISEAHANLIFSLFIVKITSDIYVENPAINTCLGTTLCNLKERVTNILEEEVNNAQTAQHVGSPSMEVGELNVHLFCCLEDLQHQNDNKVLIDDFDKIDLYSDNENANDECLTDENTLISSKVNDSLDSSVRISKQTLSLTKVTLLPSKELENCWESLFFDNDIKQKMFSYATIALKVATLSREKANSNIDSSNIFSNNKLLIVHGPPGTGKTTVCKALVQKLSIRREFSCGTNPIDTRHKGILVEISCSRIFSRWFGESSKNLSSIFTDVENLLKLNENSFVCLLIDEVEAIAISRDELLNKSESTDGVRVVSTLLTLLDRLKKYNNLIVLATSNLLNSLDPAFIDRADGVFHIGNPSKDAIIEILTSTLRELMRKNIISCPFNALSQFKYEEVISLIASKCLVCSCVENFCKLKTCFTNIIFQFRDLT